MLNFMPNLLTNVTFILKIKFDFQKREFREVMRSFLTKNK